MKKLAVILLAVSLFGCKPMDRVNPTDPAGTSYIGWTYVGEIGNFKKLADFTVAVDPSDGRDCIFAVDSQEERIHKFYTDGTNLGYIMNPPTPVFFNPTGICSMAGNNYIIDNISIDAYQIDNLTAWSDTGVTGDKILAYGSMLYVAKSDPPAVSRFTESSHVYSPAGTWSITKGDTTCAYCMSYISGMAAGTAGEILLADLVLKRISVFNASTGAWIRNIDVGYAPAGMVLYNNSTLYVPCAAGILRINYTTGAVIDTIANYGEGNGKVAKPGPIALYTNPSDGKKYIFAGSDTFIKVFETNNF